MNLALLGLILAGLLLSGCAPPPEGQSSTPPPASTPSPQPAAPSASPTSSPVPPSPTTAAQPTAAPTASPSPSPTSPPQPTSTQPASTPTGQATPSGAAVPAGAEPAVEKAKQDAAKQAGVPVAQVTVVSARAVQWPDSSLGCPQPGYAYSQVVTPGYLIVLRAGGKTYEYHSDRAGEEVVTCANPKPPIT
jgi:cytoskeletal protein RodZ